MVYRGDFILCKWLWCSVCMCMFMSEQVCRHLCNIYIFPSAHFSAFSHLSGSQKRFQQLSQRLGDTCSPLRRFWVWARGLLPVGHVHNVSRGSLAGSTFIRSQNHLNWLLLHIKEWWLYFIRIHKLPTLSPRMGPGTLQMKVLSPDSICILLLL